MAVPAGSPSGINARPAKRRITSSNADAEFIRHFNVPEAFAGDLSHAGPRQGGGKCAVEDDDELEIFEIEGVSSTSFDLEDSEQSDDDSHHMAVAYDSTSRSLHDAFAAPSDAERRVLSLVNEFRSCAKSRAACDKGEECDALAAFLSSRGIPSRVSASVVDESDMFRSIRHEFVIAFVARDASSGEVPPVGGGAGSALLGVTEMPSCAGSEVVVDMFFAGQFEVPRASSSYQQLLSRGTPECFVGSAQRLLRVATLLATAMASSFAESAMALPPWRCHKALLGCWFKAGGNKSYRSAPC